jgi:uncharacterized membrane protein
VFLLLNVSFLCSVLALRVFLSVLVAQCQLSVYCFGITGLLGVFLLFNVSFLCSVLALLVFLGILVVIEQQEYPKRPVMPKHYTES